MTPEQLPARLAALAAKAGQDAAPAAANAMALAYQADVVRSMHGPAPSKSGTPPARRSGTLARSVRPKLAAGGGQRATSSVAPHTVYARIQQLGGKIEVVRAKVLGTPKTGFFGKRVKLPPRPYMVMTAARRAKVRRAAVQAIKRAVLGG